MSAQASNTQDPVPLTREGGHRPDMSRLTPSLTLLCATAAIGAAGAGTALGAAQHAAKVSPADKTYLQTAIEGDRFEVAGGKLAQQQGSTKAVKDYGARLVTDHTKSLKEATALAKKLGIAVPKAPSPSMQWELQTVAKFSGKQFDDNYAELEAKDHQQDISEAQDEVKDGTNSQIRSSAKKEIPTLQEHLKIAEQLGGKQGTDPLP
jgi:putative membrane protein